ncbi:RHS repeat-associated core domain-containing protein [Pseudomonas sp. BW13M1]|uniref:RHS repeat-associated core domain-containing protein n=1 Tax=Pseudomonas peradeniyensis TaxID=2745488 RepID=A0A923K023_9PSED|nr:RHS repeat-associated core domain-containing protein [Pseudomonas peradeniyensis]MBV4507331.1 RHS repeat-associated core domain-containing protein [Pseudomonas peradeniyensis]
MPDSVNRPVAKLLVTDQKASVLSYETDQVNRVITYSAFGYRSLINEQLSILGFNGEYQERTTGYYLLGNGYRAFSPELMRFTSPDSLSPFEKGGVNTYVYCQSEPINQKDSTGHFGERIRKWVSGLFSTSTPSYKTKNHPPAQSLAAQNQPIPEQPISVVSTNVSRQANLDQEEIPLEAHGYQIIPFDAVGYRNMLDVNINRLKEIYRNLDSTPEQIQTAENNMKVIHLRAKLSEKLGLLPGYSIRTEQ